MMLQLNLTNDTSMTVELVDDPWIHKWAKHVVTLDLHETEHTALGANNQNFPQDQFHYAIDELIDAAKLQLPGVGMPVPDFLPSALELKSMSHEQYQKEMNTFHRWLVFCMFRQPFYVNSKNTIPSSIDEKFDKDFEGMLRVLFTLNQLVHKTEEGYTSPGTDSFPSSNYGEIYWDQGFNGDDKIGKFKDEPVHHLLTNDNYDVWLAKRILGKDFRECWLDADNPAYKDITNIGEILHYCFEVDPLNDDSHFYNSGAFKQWMQEHNRSVDNSAIGRIPIGNIIDKPENLKQVMQTCKIESIELV